MKKIREVSAKILTYIYAVGISFSLFMGALTVFGYIAALIVGGEIASQICNFIYKGFYPVIVYISSVSILIGLVKMYISGEKSLVPSMKKKKDI